MRAGCRHFCEGRNPDLFLGSRLHENDGSLSPNRTMHMATGITYAYPLLESAAICEIGGSIPIHRSPGRMHLSDEPETEGQVTGSVTA